MFKRITQIVVAAAVLLSAGCAAERPTATAVNQKERFEIPIVTGVGDMIGSLIQGRAKTRRVLEQPVLDVATTPVGE